MKRTITSILIASALVCGCQIEKQGPESPLQGLKTISFSVSDETWNDESTKSAFDGSKISVSGDENIGVFRKGSDGKLIGIATDNTFSSTAGENLYAIKAVGTSGNYAFDVPAGIADTTTFFTIMPYSKNLTKLFTSRTKAILRLSPVQYPGENTFDPMCDFMIGRPFTAGTGSGSVTQFKRIFTPFKLTLSGLEDSDRIYAVNFSLSQDPVRSGLQCLTGYFTLALGQTFGGSKIDSVDGTGMGNSLTAIYENGLPKGTDGWPVWFIANPMNIAADTEISITVSTATKTYRRTVKLPAAAALCPNKFNELAINVKGSGYTESDSFTQMLMDGNYSSGINKLTATDGNEYEWSIYNNVNWLSSEAERDNGSGLPNGFYLYTSRSVTYPLIGGKQCKRITMYGYPAGQFNSNNDYVMTLNSGDTQIASVSYNFSQHGDYTGLYRTGGIIEFRLPAGYSSLCKSTFHGVKGWSLFSAATIETCEPTVDKTIEMNFYQYKDENASFVWPFNEKKSECIGTSWKSNPRTLNLTIGTENYPISIKVSTDCVSNSSGVLKFGGALGDYIQFPAIEGYKLVRVEWTGTTGVPQLTDISGNMLVAGNSFSFTTDCETAVWCPAKTEVNTSYRMTASTERYMQVRNIKLGYEHVD